MLRPTTLILAALATLALGCESREGERHYLNYPDADAPDGDADADDDSCPNRPGQWITPGELVTLRSNPDLVVDVVDIRRAEEYGAGHIPDAVSNPWTDGSLETVLVLVDTDSLVLYDWNGQTVPDVEAWLDLCTPEILMIDGGFAGWAALGFDVETE